MGVANEQIRVSDIVKHEIDQRRREGESYNDVLERILAEADTGDFYNEFGRWSNEIAKDAREERRKAKKNGNVGYVSGLRILREGPRRHVLIDYLDALPR